MQLPQLKRIRWAVRAALFLGVAASVAANILHALPNPISQAISAWPPLALLLTVELTSRIPMHKPLLAFVRVLATITIAGIAAWVSYWHMQSVAQRYGETAISAYLLPISVDGLIVVASVSLVELAGRIRMLEEARDRLAEAPAAAPAVAPVQFVQPSPAVVTVPQPAPAFQAPAEEQRELVAARLGAWTPTRATAPLEDDDEFEDDETAEPVSTGGPAHGSIRGPMPAAPVSPAIPMYANGGAVRAAVSAPARSMVTESTSAPRPRRAGRPVSETVELADAIEAMQPDITEDELANRLGISANRLRQVRREAAANRLTARS